MDTSDSEYFESADEEIYDEANDNKLPKKCKEKNVLEIKEGLINLSVADHVKNSQEKHVHDNLNIEENLVNKNNEESITNRQSNESNGKSNYENTNINSQFPDKIKLMEPVEIICENMDTFTISSKIVEKKEECESEIIQTKHKSLKVEPEIIDANLIHTIISKKEESIIKNSDNEGGEENMWGDIDNWESVLDQNKPVLSDNNNENHKSETTSRDRWDTNDWKPFLNTKKVDLDDKITNDKGNLQPSTEDKENDNMWENDDWEPLENESKPNQLEIPWSPWGNWGVSSILTTATQGVSTLTNQVSQGISTVFESSMGIPDPTELARQDKIVETPELASNKSITSFGFGNLSNFVSGVSHITKFVENTGSKVITGGLDTLETIGKKTMEVLQDGDPGLKNKRALLKLDKEKPILSQVLREAKERSEKENKVLQEVHSKKKLNYETLFDDYHGLVHLEALEMLSKQCDIQLQTLCENSSGNELQDLQETMDQIKELCELPDEDDDETPVFDDIKSKIQTAVKDVNVNITYEKLLSTWEETEQWLNNLKIDFCDETELHREALQVLARLTAIAVEQFHKCGELLLIKERRSTADEADSLVQLTMAVTSLIGLVAAKFSEKLNTKSFQTGNKDQINELITNVFFEAGNSSSYVQDAFQLLIPVLQIGAV